ncbi:MAG: hypothetical protein SGI89_00590 [bacterium]|nr:hypothetical protein [bacterium]
MMKKNLLVITLLMLTAILFTNNVFAQKESNKTPEQMATKMADRMKEKLSLTEDQYKQVYNMALTNAQDRINNKEKNKSLDKESRKLLKKQNKENFRKQMEGILDKDQMTKFQEMKGKHKHDKKNKDGKKKDRKNKKEFK